jgi:hypothetical protein
VKVRELIERLGRVNQEADMALFWDGAPRGEVEGICRHGEETIVLVGEWCIYRDGIHRAFPEVDVLFDANTGLHRTEPAAGSGTVRGLVVPEMEATR